jgi:hypothetical protein
MHIPMMEKKRTFGLIPLRIPRTKSTPKERYNGTRRGEDSESIHTKLPPPRPHTTT